MNVLVIDDIETNLILIETILEEWFDCNVVTCERISSLSDIVPEMNKSDIIILDLNMPRYSGTEVYKEFRKENKDTPVIITTSYTYESIKEHFKNDKNVYYLSKGIDVERFVELVKTLEKDIVES